MEELTGLRLRAERLLNDDYARGLLDLVPELREDTQQWPHVWAPAAAIAAHRAGQPDAIRFLREAIDAGFSQPEFFEGDLERSFDTHADWPALLERMRANVPPPPIELLAWPAPPPSLQVELCRIDGGPVREAELRKRLPEPGPGAWETARDLLRWVAQRWKHANDHVAPDALEILDRVDGGSRFACDEYAVVLAQGLNALGIPARRVGLFQRDHYFGVGRAHSVAEAWIDDLDSWVLLDGQNGAYWRAEAGRPLSTHELHGIFSAGGRRPELVCLADPLSEQASEFWWTYFAAISTTGANWMGGPFSPIFQERFLLGTDRLVAKPEDAYPRLSDTWVSVTGTREAPALTFGTTHPYARGFVVACCGRRTELATGDPEWCLDLMAGGHEATVSIVTDYGENPAGTVAYRVRPSTPQGP
ncbi:transglutaminase-like domain-containing protein [Flindersiella endophytica]